VYLCSGLHLINKSTAIEDETDRFLDGNYLMMVGCRRRRHDCHDGPN